LAGVALGLAFLETELRAVQNVDWDSEESALVAEMCERQEHNESTVVRDEVFAVLEVPVALGALEPATHLCFLVKVFEHGEWAARMVFVALASAVLAFLVVLGTGMLDAVKSAGLVLATSGPDETVHVGQPGAEPAVLDTRVPGSSVVLLDLG